MLYLRPPTPARARNSCHTYVNVQLVAMLTSSSRLRAQSIDSAHRAKSSASGGDYHADTPRVSEAVGMGTYHGHGIANNQGGMTGGIGGRAGGKRIKVHMSAVEWAGNE